MFPEVTKMFLWITTIIFLFIMYSVKNKITAESTLMYS